MIEQPNRKWLAKPKLIRPAFAKPAAWQPPLSHSAQRRLVAGAGVEPARGRLMRPLPFLLATPRFEKVARRLCSPINQPLYSPPPPRCTRRGGEVLETRLRKLAPAVL